ncbi:tail protein X [Campylobacter concisus]|uniref:tail protein X n=1 Tax=Campylobacter concisus TaxID=199 RepID=UPI000CD831C8|nr:tail protein X [Campylobacter concisus]
MKIYIAKDDESLDMICFKIYGSLDQNVYSEFLRENEHLLHKTKLKSGDEVNLPSIEPQEEKKAKYLWE